MKKIIKAHAFDKTVYDLVSNGVSYPIKQAKETGPDGNLIDFVLADGKTRPNGKNTFSFYPTSEMEVSIKGPGTDGQLWAMLNLWFCDEWEVWASHEIDELQPLIDLGYVWLDSDEHGPEVGLTGEGREFVEAITQKWKSELASKKED